jgi:hypothetical protein
MKQPRRDLKGDPSGMARAIQYGGIEDFGGMDRGLVDGDDEGEMFFELCLSCFPAVQPDGLI